VTRATKATTRLLQLAWAFMTVVSLLAGVYVISLSIHDYLQYDVFTQTKRVQPGRNLLPAVTFCLDASNSANLSDLFLHAHFQQDLNNVSVSAQIFRPRIHLDEPYRCIRFNQHRPSGHLFYTSNAEFFFFNISLAASYTFIDVYLSDNYLQTLSTNNFVSGFPYATREIYIELTKSLETKLGEPFNECQTMTDNTYRQSNCLAECQEGFFAHKYNCSLNSYYSVVPDLASCDEDSTLDLKEFDSTCEGQCPKECETVKFDSVVSSYNSPYLTVQVAFLDLSFIKISQIPKMTVVSLISNIGGALGLFVGVRFISLLELFEYLSEIFAVFYRNKTASLDLPN
jgi:hypothetical protein